MRFSDLVEDLVLLPLRTKGSWTQFPSQGPARRCSGGQRRGTAPVDETGTSSRQWLRRVGVSTLQTPLRVWPRPSCWRSMQPTRFMDCSCGACSGESRFLNHSTLIVICETRAAENRKPNLPPATASPIFMVERWSVGRDETHRSIQAVFRVQG